MTKGITMATAKAVAAGNSCRQEDIIATANLSRRAIADMLHSCKVQQRFLSGTHDPLCVLVTTAGSSHEGQILLRHVQAYVLIKHQKPT